MSQQPEAASDGPAAIAGLEAVVDKLRSPGGCPWDAAQTHASLAPFCIEEAYEVAEAIETSDWQALPGELGDLLLQVVIHCRVSQDEDARPFTLADVARAESEKLIRRHPHVFSDPGGEAPRTPSQSHQLWDQVKSREPGRDSAFDGIPLAQGALARAQKLTARARRANLVPDDGWPGSLRAAMTGRALAVLDLVGQADAAGADLEAEVRAAASALEAHLREAEAGAPGRD